MSGSAEEKPPLQFWEKKGYSLQSSQYSHLQKQKEEKKGRNK